VRRPVQSTLRDILINAQTNIEKSVFSNAALSEKQEIGRYPGHPDPDLCHARTNELARIVAKLQAEP
jgi:hypothetical protein